MHHKMHCPTEVEANLDPEDIETRLQLRGAYDIGLGNLSCDEEARRRFQHHLRAVELGADPIHTLAQARILVMGALEVPPNEKEAICWYKTRYSRVTSRLCMSCNDSTGISKGETARARVSLIWTREENRALPVTNPGRERNSRGEERGLRSSRTMTPSTARQQPACTSVGY